MTLRLFLAGLLLAGVAGCATVPRGPSAAGGEFPVPDVCAKYAMDCRWDAVAQTVTMTRGPVSVRAMVGSRVVVSNGNKVLLAGPLVMRHGLVMAGADLENKVIAPLFAVSGDKAEGHRLMGKIVLDAGHGGKDSGAVGFSGQKEKEVTLDIARRLKGLLEARGIQVVMTRETDAFIELKERTRLASDPSVDLFVSIHANAHKRAHAHGIEIYYSGELSAADRSDSQRLSNEKKVFGQLNMRRDSEDLKEIVSGMMYSYKLSFSSVLAENLSGALAQWTEGRTRAVRPQRFFVLRNTLVPAVLVEVGFLSNPTEERRLKAAAHRQHLAEAIMKGIEEFIYAKRS
jgi:N-acetylmuramoyl-L-alanine amidase